MNYQVLSFVLFFSFTAISNPILSELSQEELHTLVNNGPIIKTFKPEGDKFSGIISYGIVPLNFKKAAAVFGNLGRWNTYQSSVVHSKLLSKNGAYLEAEFDIKLPFPFKDDFQTLQYFLKETTDSRFHIEWKLLNARKAKTHYGYAMLEPYNKDQAIFKLKNQTDPGISVAPDKKVIETLSSSVTDYLKEAKRIVEKNDQETLEKDLENLDFILEGL
ncbi:MAG: hypothetical protein H6620_10920 [Halobacteriovoraceae bacterium]|nr:hypothetical protein [Halobacteriovoraceae bacterium]